jgi:hypothetical protein
MIHLRHDEGKGKGVQGNWDGTLSLCPFGRRRVALPKEVDTKTDTKRVRKGIVG